MMTKLLIDIPSHIDSDKKLADWVSENPECFFEAMDLDVSFLDDRATVDEVKITDVDIDNEKVIIYYEYDYSLYYGCRDMDYANTSDVDEIVGVKQGHTLSFEKFKPVERRSSFEEL